MAMAKKTELIRFKKQIVDKGTSLAVIIPSYVIQAYNLKKGKKYFFAVEVRK